MLNHVNKESFNYTPKTHIYIWYHLYSKEFLYDILKKYYTIPQIQLEIHTIQIGKW